MAITADEYLTVPEAAALLKVSPSTIWRWMKRSELRAYRVGRRHVRLKKAELDQAVPLAVRSQQAIRWGVQNDQIAQLRRPLTDEEKRRWEAAAEQAEQDAKALLAERGGERFSPSWELLDEVRNERTRQLEQQL